MSEAPRAWQQPLSEEKIALLVDQFAKAKARIEEIWGPGQRRWRRNG
jgi:hypothetical protein